MQRVLKHPGAVFGCAWSPFETNTLATSCYDHNVYLWHIGTPQESSAPVVVLHGHKAKVFNVAWSPLLPDMLLSGSDDRTARVSPMRPSANNPISQCSRLAMFPSSPT